ncbi:MAG: hypothetical protein WCF33_01815 [Pseudonocardiaceae bacterium]
MVCPGVPESGVLRFEGWIAGLGTAAGLRVVIGHWTSSPWGPFTDVMVEQPDGHRVLLAPQPAVAEFIAGIYQFDDVRTVGVNATVDGARWQIVAPPIEVTFDVGGRSTLGLLLRAVPRWVATSSRWIAAIDQVARRVFPGVRTRGSAGGGREELYAALDLRRIVGARVVWGGVDQGSLAPVTPPVRFGFGSTPPTPSLVHVLTLVRHG